MMNKKKIRIFIIFFILLLNLNYKNENFIIRSLLAAQVNKNFNENNNTQNFSEKSLEKIINFVKIFKSNSLIKITDEEIIDKMIAGFLKEVDQYGSFFLNEEQYKQFNEKLRNTYNGIGISLKKNNLNFFQIDSIQKNSIAQKAGLQIGDIVNLINNSKPEKEGILECEIDQNINLNIIRNDSEIQNSKQNLENNNEKIGSQKSFNILLSCQNLKQQNFEFKFIDNQIAVLKIYTFAENLSKEIDETLKNTQVSNLKGLIIDLRDNGGGLRDEAVDLASRFLEKKSLLFSLKNNEGKIISKFESKPELFLKNLSGINIAILVNKNSASASELFTGAMKENKRAIVVGQKTFGKGLGQNIFNFNGQFLKITVSSFVTPDGNEIQSNGILPDIDLYEDFEFTNIFFGQSKNNLKEDGHHEDFLKNDLELYITYKILKTKNL